MLSFRFIVLRQHLKIKLFVTVEMLGEAGLVTGKPSVNNSVKGKNNRLRNCKLEV